MKNLVKLLVAVLALLVLTATPSRADSFTTFTVEGTFKDSTSLSGTFTLDTTTGAITGFDLVTAIDTFTPANSTGEVDSLTHFLPNAFEFFFRNDTGGVHSLDLWVSGSCPPFPMSGRCLPVGFNGGNLIPQLVIFGLGSEEGGIPGPGPISEFDLPLTTGSVIASPEPSSVMLISFGILLGVLARVWRRMRLA